MILTTILAANAVSLDQFYGDRSCSCSRCSSPTPVSCCDDKDNYNCILCYDDNSLSTDITLTNQPLYFYGESYAYAYVSNIRCIISYVYSSLHFLQISTKGIILLFNKRVNSSEVKLRSFINDSFPIKDYVFIAPFYGNIDKSYTTESKGTCYSRAGDTDENLLDKAEGQINRTGDRDFSPKYLLIATWDYQNDQVHNIQASLILLDPVSSQIIG